MTLYRPLISDGNTRMREATTSEYNAMLTRIAYLYEQNPTVTLSVVASGGNISPAMRDRRYYTGTSQDTGDAAFGTATNPVVVNDITYDKISQTVTAETLPTYSLKPVRMDGNSGVREISQQDVIDTYIAPVIDNMIAYTTAPAGYAAGSYFISTAASEANATQLGIVYTDTRSVGFGSYPLLTGSGQQFFDVNTINTYYLHKVNSVSASFRTPLIVDGTAGLRHMTTAEFETYFEQLIRYCIYNETGQRLRYNVNGSGGTVQGSVMVDSFYEGSTQVDRVTDPSDTDPNDYISQLQPSGTINTDTTYSLKLERT